MILTVDDVNDNPPMFLQDPVLVGVPIDATYIDPITTLQVSASARNLVMSGIVLGSHVLQGSYLKS